MARVGTQAVSWEGFTPIHAAAAYGHAAVLDMMLTFGGDPKQATPTGVRQRAWDAGRQREIGIAGAQGLMLAPSRCLP